MLCLPSDLSFELVLDIDWASERFESGSEWCEQL